MLYVNWHVVWIVLLAVLLIVTPWLVYWSVRRKTRQWIVIAPLAATPFGLAGGAVLFLMFTFRGSDSYSAPIRSPDGACVARVEAYQGFFSTDGGVNILVYRLMGFSSAAAYQGDVYSADAGDVLWVGPSRLHVRYSDPDANCDPHPASWLTVECEYAAPGLTPDEPQAR